MKTIAFFNSKSGVGKTSLRKGSILMGFSDTVKRAHQWWTNGAA
jgi:hypothetical protein